MTHSRVLPILMLASVAVASCALHRGSPQIRLVDAQLPLPDAAPDEHVAAGRRLLDAGNHGLALGEFRAALLKDPRSAAAENGLAIAYAALGRDDLARRHFQLARDDAPDNPVYARNFERFAAANAAEDDTGVLAVSSMTVAIPPATDAAPPAQAAPGNRIVAGEAGQVLLMTRPASRAPGSPTLLTMIDGAMARLATAMRPTLERASLGRVNLHVAPVAGATLEVALPEATPVGALDAAGGRAQIDAAVTRARLRGAAARARGTTAARETRTDCRVAGTQDACSA